MKRRDLEIGKKYFIFVTDEDKIISGGLAKVTKTKTGREEPVAIILDYFFSIDSFTGKIYRLEMGPEVSGSQPEHLREITPENKKRFSEFINNIKYDIIKHVWK